MQVRHGFAAIASVVDDEAKTSFVQAEFGGHLGSFQQQVAEKVLIIRTRLGEARNGFLGHDQNVRGGLGMNVADGEDKLIFINYRSRNFARGDFFK